jgi:hypothetical protein
VETVHTRHQQRPNNCNYDCTSNRVNVFERGVTLSGHCDVPGRDHAMPTAAMHIVTQLSSNIMWRAPSTGLISVTSVYRTSAFSWNSKDSAPFTPRTTKFSLPSHSFIKNAVYVSHLWHACYTAHTCNRV